jgi:hypothetical protein
VGHWGRPGGAASGRQDQHQPGGGPDIFVGPAAFAVHALTVSGRASRSSRCRPDSAWPERQPRLADRCRPSLTTRARRDINRCGLTAVRHGSDSGSPGALLSDPCQRPHHPPAALKSGPDLHYQPCQTRVSPASDSRVFVTAHKPRFEGAERSRHRRHRCLASARRRAPSLRGPGDVSPGTFSGAAPLMR